MKKSKNTSEISRQKVSDPMILSELDEATRELFQKFSPRECEFIVRYTLLGEPTCSNATASAKAAGFSERSAGNQGWLMLQRREIKETIYMIHKSRMDSLAINPERVLHDLNDEHDRAIAKGDLSTAVRATELMGKYLLMFSENVNINLFVGKGKDELTDMEKEEAQKIASIRMKEIVHHPGDPPRQLVESTVVEAEAETETVGTQIG